MLLVFDADLQHALASGDPGITEAFQVIAGAARLGHHLVTGPRLLLKQLATHPDLTPLARTVYHKLYEGLPKMKALTMLFPKYIHIVAEGDLVAEEQDEVCQVRVPLSYFINPGLVAETALLCENLAIDTVFYEMVGRYWLDHRALDHIPLYLDPRPGGGNTTATAYAKIQERGQPLMLCITDSDRKSPQHDPGQTAKAVAALDNPGKRLCEHVLLNVRTIENLVPTAVYADLAERDPSLTQALADLRWLESRPDEARPYLHFKNGLKLKELCENKNAALARFWLSILETRPGFRDTCWQTNPCQKKEKCQCRMITGFGGKIMETLLKEKSLTEMAPHVSEAADLHAEWCRLGGKIAAWGCGWLPMRTLPGEA